jgi:hypothetical protein
MASQTVSSTSHIVSSDMGFFQVKIHTVKGYDMEDVVHDKAVSQARAIQMMILGKRIDPTKPVASRSLQSTWLNNEEELPT